jgi:hypothetical protein
MRAAGFNGAVVGESPTSLQWLVRQLIDDPRFADGAVKFWWSAVYGEEPLYPPESTDDFDFDTRLRAFEAQNDDIDAFAERFRTGAGGNGRFNLKDLLVDMVMADRFRVVSSTGIPDGGADSYRELGHTRRLTPEALQRKMESLTGDRWICWIDEGAFFEQDRIVLNLTSIHCPYYMLYGGIDSINVTSRPGSLSTVMRAVVELYGNRASGQMLAWDFVKGPEDRLLFPHVEPSTGPENSAAIHQTISHLLSHLWGIEQGPGDPDFDDVVDIWLGAYQSGRQLLESGELHEFDGGWAEIGHRWAEYEKLPPESREGLDRFENYPQRLAWRAVLAYLLTDADFLYQ